MILNVAQCEVVSWKSTAEKTIVKVLFKSRNPIQIPQRHNNERNLRKRKFGIRTRSTRAFFGVLQRNENEPFISQVP